MYLIDVEVESVMNIFGWVSISEEVESVLIRWKCTLYDSHRKVLVHVLSEIIN